MSGDLKPVPSLVTIEALATALNERGVSLAIIPPRMTGLGAFDAAGAVVPIFGIQVERVYRGRTLAFSAQGFSLEAALRQALSRFDEEWRGIIVAEQRELKQDPPSPFDPPTWEP